MGVMVLEVVIGVEGGMMMAVGEVEVVEVEESGSGEG